MVGEINASFITGGVRNFYSVSTSGYPHCNQDVQTTNPPPRSSSIGFDRRAIQVIADHLEPWVKLRTARADEKSEAIAATIIGYIRGLALGSPFVPYGATSLVTPDDSGMTAYVATTKDGVKRPEELSA